MNHTTSDRQQTPPDDQRLTLSKEALAVAALVEHPDWTHKEIAKAAGCHKHSLYRMKQYMGARAAIQQAKADMPRGSKSKDGEMESWDEE